MRAFVPVSATHLNGVAVETHQGRFTETTLLPFFAQDGTILWIMLVFPDRGDLLGFSPQKGCCDVPVFGRTVRVNVPLEALDDEVLDRIAEHWHYDPWWLLTAERFRELSALSALKNTNCVDYFTKSATELLYDRRFRKVRMTVDETDSGKSLANFGAASLRTRPLLRPEESKPKREQGWYLDPFWM